MWAFYAEEHQGAVIEFATSHAFFVEDPMLRTIHYSDTRPTTHYGDTSLGYTYEKSLDWQYEREWRTQERFRKMTRHLLEDGKIIHLMSVPPECFKAVYLGARIETQQKNQFLALMKEERHRHIALYQCQPSLTQFALQFIPATD